MSNPTHEFPNLALIREGINFRFDVTIGKLTLTMRPLSTFEEEKLEMEIKEEMKSSPDDGGIKRSALLSVKKLCRAQTSHPNMKDWKMSEMELSNCTPAELQFIFKEYLAGCDKVNPRLESYSKAEVVKWVDVLKKNTQNMETTLIESSFYQLVALSLHLLTASESPTDS